MKIYIQRIYAKEQMKGYRVLVDRLWPRGISKQQAMLDGWYKDLAPDTDLRKWFNHEEGKWREFRTKYLHGLDMHIQIAQDLLEDAKGESSLILLYGAKDETHNHAVILKEFLERLLHSAKARDYASPACFAHEGSKNP